MADLVMGAMGSLIPMLSELLKEEYNLQAGVKERVKFLTRELEAAQAALHKVSEVPWDQLDGQVRLWAREVRESSYDMEDVLDSFLVRVQGGHDSTKQEGLLKRLGNLIKKSKARRKISGDVKDIMSHLREVMERCRRYKVEDINVLARPATASTVDPRLAAMYTQVNTLVGIDKWSGELISMLQSPRQQEDVFSTSIKIVSVVGVGGLGKTTLAKAVYEKIKGDFRCGAFVPVGRNPDLKKVFKDILIELDKQRYLHYSWAVLDERQLIDELRDFFLEKKRYFVVIDDIWETESWETIKLAIVDNNCEGRIIITTRKLEVATKADEVYKLQPLPFESATKLFNTRISGGEQKCVDNQPDQISEKVLMKCGGIPLAIITMASLLADKPREKWSELIKAIGFGSEGNKEAKNTMRILSFSYYDLPSHLRTCLLYLSAFPEDSVIPKDALVWKWIAEGFIHEKRGISLFEIGEGYFNDLINRSMIQTVETGNDYEIICGNDIYGCRVHDMVLDFIRSISREETFLTALDNNDQSTPLYSDARRLAQHNSTIGEANSMKMPKVRTFIVQGCLIEMWEPLSSFNLLRVLALEHCKLGDGGCTGMEHLRHLIQLRYLCLRGTGIYKKILEEIGELSFLQTLDLTGTKLQEMPSSISLLKRLMCLRITLNGGSPGRAPDLVNLTSLEELVIHVNTWRPVKGLGSLRKLRVLKIMIDYDEEMERYLVESLRHFHKLQHLEIYCWLRGRYDQADWEAAGFVLPGHLRHLNIYGVKFPKLPSCINPSHLPNLTYLSLNLVYIDEQGLKILGRLGELRFLGLDLRSSATIANISDRDAGYFLKLRRCTLRSTLLLFLGNKEDEKISFHTWSGQDDITILFGSSDEYKTSVSDYHMQRPKWPFLKMVGQDPFISGRGSAPGNDEKDIARPSAASDDGMKGPNCSKGPPATCFMPSIQVLDFIVPERIVRDHPYCLDNLGLEYLSSLQEINVLVRVWGASPERVKEVEAALRRTADKHPNRLKLHMEMMRW